MIESCDMKRTYAVRGLVHFVGDSVLAGAHAGSERCVGVLGDLYYKCQSI